MVFNNEHCKVKYVHITKRRCMLYEQHKQER